MPKTLHLLKQVPYGEADYRKIRFGNYLYVDKTRYIESLENCGSNYTLVVRPRRFGKSLFVDTLQLYYDKAQAANFDVNFSGTYIGSHKTALAGQFYVLKFVFAGISSGNVVRNFYDCVLSSLYDFFTAYPHPRQNEILQGHFDGAAALIERFFAVLPSLSKYFLIANQEGTEKINGHPISARKEKSNSRENPFQGDFG